MKTRRYVPAVVFTVDRQSSASYVVNYVGLCNSLWTVVNIDLRSLGTLSGWRADRIPSMLSSAYTVSSRLVMIAE